jgi:hypothetical protein
MPSRTVATVTWTTDRMMRRLFPEVLTSDGTDASGMPVLLERDALTAIACCRRRGDVGPAGSS